MKRSIVYVALLSATLGGLSAGEAFAKDPKCLNLSASILIEQGADLLCRFNDHKTGVEAGGFDVDKDGIVKKADGLNYEELSPGSNSTTIQLGHDNFAFGLIIQSPETEITQTQIGWFNHSQVGVVGGAQNEVNVLQQGNYYKSDIYLLNSEGTTVNNFQMAGQNQVKSLIVINGKPGTKINMNN